MADQKSQSDKFIETAREISADENEKRWEKQLRRVAKAKRETTDRE